MNILTDGFKKALNNILSLRDTETLSLETDSELNPYKRDVRRYESILRDENASFKDKIDAIRQIGHNAYTGGPEVSKFVGSQLLDDLLNIMKEGDPPLGTGMKMQIIKSLSEILHQSKENQVKLRNNAGSLSCLVDAVGDRSKKKMCRWACYTLATTMADNVPLMRDILQIENVEQKLRNAALLPEEEWDGWPENYAEVLLRLLGLPLPTKLSDSTEEILRQKEALIREVRSKVRAGRSGDDDDGKVSIPKTAAEASAGATLRSLLSPKGLTLPKL